METIIRKMLDAGNNLPEIFEYFRHNYPDVPLTKVRILIMKLINKE